MHSSDKSRGTLHTAPRAFPAAAGVLAPHTEREEYMACLMDPFWHHWQQGGAQWPLVPPHPAPAGVVSEGWEFSSKSVSWRKSGRDVTSMQRAHYMLRASHARYIGEDGEGQETYWNAHWQLMCSAPGSCQVANPRVQILRLMTTQDFGCERIGNWHGQVLLVVTHPQTCRHSERAMAVPNRSSYSCIISARPCNSLQCTSA